MDDCDKRVIKQTPEMREYKRSIYKKNLCDAVKKFEKTVGDVKDVKVEEYMDSIGNSFEEIFRLSEQYLEVLDDEEEKNRVRGQLKEKENVARNAAKEENFVATEDIEENSMYNVIFGNTDSDMSGLQTSANPPDSSDAAFTMHSSVPKSCTAWEVSTSSLVKSSPIFSHSFTRPAYSTASSNVAATAFNASFSPYNPSFSANVSSDVPVSCFNASTSLFLTQNPSLSMNASSTQMFSQNASNSQMFMQPPAGFRAVAAAPNYSAYPAPGAPMWGSVPAFPQSIASMPMHSVSNDPMFMQSPVGFRPAAVPPNFNVHPIPGAPMSMWGGPTFPQSSLEFNQPVANSGNFSRVNPQPESETAQLVKMLVAELRTKKLPPPEPSTFQGDPIEYPDWKVRFDMLVESEIFDPGEKLYYLGKYTSGVARESIALYLNLCTEEAYIEAKNTLQQEFGNSYIVTNAFRSKLEKWPHM